MHKNKTKKTFSILLYFSAICLLIAAAATVNFAQQRDCNQVLLERNLTLSNSYDYKTVVYLHSIDQEQFNQIKQKGTANVPGYFAGTWDNFQEERRKLKELTSYNATTEQSRSTLQSIGLAGATEAWLACMNSGASAFYGTFAEPLEGEEFFVKVKWKPAEGTGEKPIRIVRSDLKGLSTGTMLPMGETSFKVRRRTPKSDILLSVTGKSGTRNLTFVVYIPLPVKLPPPPPYNQLGSCVGPDGSGVKGVQLWGPIGVNCAGVPTPPWGTYLTNTSLPKPKKLGSCLGHGGVEGVRLWGPEGLPCGGIAHPDWLPYGAPFEDLSTVTICGCVGDGGVKGLILWGPKDAPCGGISAWGKHDQYCIPPK